MPCYHPISAYRIKGSKHYKTGNEVIVFNFPRGVSRSRLENLQLPCGQCIGCRLEYSRQWAFRCLLEASYYEYNYFITLTYDDEHLPRKFSPIVDKKTGELEELRVSYPLEKNALSAFMKRLRIEAYRKFGFDNIRFYGCGEYGSKNGRPHYHVLVFNCPIPDLVPAEKSRSGGLQYKSKFLESVWKFGRVRFSEVNFQTCAYVARYMTKKHKGEDSDYYEKNGLLPEYVRMSRRPGIASRYYHDHKDKIYHYDNFIVKNGDNAFVSKPPKYFDRMFDLDDHDSLVEIKQARKDLAESQMQFELLNTSKSYFQYLLVKEDVALSKVKSLMREL